MSSRNFYRKIVDILEQIDKGELLRPQGYVASYPTDCVIVDFLRPLLSRLTSGR